MDQIQRIKNWFDKNSGNFSIEKNGFNDSPILPYISTLPLIDRDGKILDCGSGNGMLLRFLVDFSGRSLIAFGVDKNLIAIQTAQTEILPESSINFTCSEIDDYIERDNKFNIIICNPFHTKSKLTEHISKLIRLLDRQGKLILHVYEDLQEEKKFDELEMALASIEAPCHYSKGVAVSFWQILKP